MSQYPTIPPGVTVTSDELMQMTPLWAVKPAATPRASTTTVTNDTDLTISLPRAGTWAFEAWLNYTGGTLGSSDLKLTMAYSGTSTFGVWGLNGITTASTSGMNAGANGLTGTLAIGTSGGTFFTADIKGLVVATTTGTLSLQWAQNTSSATATNLRQGCWLRAYQTA
jgi:hypothetical protein